MRAFVRVRWLNDQTYCFFGEYYSRFKPLGWTSKSLISGGWRLMPNDLDCIVEYDHTLSFWFKGSSLRSEGFNSHAGSVFLTYSNVNDHGTGAPPVNITSFFPGVRRSTVLPC